MEVKTIVCISPRAVGDYISEHNLTKDQIISIFPDKGQYYLIYYKN